MKKKAEKKNTTNSNKKKTIETITIQNTRVNNNKQH